MQTFEEALKVSSLTWVPSGGLEAGRVGTGGDRAGCLAGVQCPPPLPTGGGHALPWVFTVPTVHACGGAPLGKELKSD